MDLHPQSILYLSSCMTSQRAFETLELLCEDIGPRPAGSDAEREACEMAVSVFKECGYDAEVAPFSYPGWSPGESTVVVQGPGGSHSIPSHPLGWCPAGNFDGRIVDGGFGTPEDLDSSVRGVAVLVSSANPPGGPALHRSDKYRFAVEAGASAFVFHDTRRGGLVPMGSVDIDGCLGSIPAIGICYEDAESLRRRIDSTTLQISASSGGRPTTSHNAVGLKRGDTEEEIVVCAHVDSWDCPGAYDNGSGSAAVIELARLLRPLSLRKSLRFILFGSEEVGLIGSHTYVNERTDIGKVTTVVNLDCVAIRDGTLAVATNGDSSLARDLEALSDALRIDARVHTGTVKHSDHFPFVEAGARGAFASSSSPAYSYAHTACDTLDKVGVDSFTLPLLLLGTAVVEWAMGTNQDDGAARP